MTRSLHTWMLILSTVACVLGPRAIAQVAPASAQEDDPRIAQLLSLLTLEEKVALLGGTEFDTKPIPRLGIPPLSMTDGPLGVRWQASTAFPSGVLMAATWNPAIIEKMGAALGQEAKAKGRYMLLGPCVNIHRTPFGGRNFESFGEDPYLAGRMAVAVVKGIQSEKVIATAKHFACNNQEHEREFTNVSVSERALREIYLPAFEAAVKEGGAWSVMSAYNKLNGLWCSENPYLLTEILKKEWGFRGFIVSDWGAVHSTVPTANAGLDIEMPTGEYLNADSLLRAINAGKVSVASIDDKIRRLLRTMAWSGLLDTASIGRGSLDTPEHRRIAQDVAAEGFVLLKNEANTLPLDLKGLKTIAVIGPNAGIARTGGGGSSRVDPLHPVTILNAIRKKVGSQIRVTYAPGCPTFGDLDPVKTEWLIPPEGTPGSHGLKGEYFSNMNLEGDPALVRVDSAINFGWGGGSAAPFLPVNKFSVRWTGNLVARTTGKFMLTMMSDDGVRVYVDGKLVIDDWKDHGVMANTYAIALEAGRKHALRVEYFENGGDATVRMGLAEGLDRLTGDAVARAREADAVLLCLGSNELIESEGFDRKDLNLPEEQLKLLTAVSVANKKTIVVLNTGAAVTTDSWIDSVPALLESWFPGQEGGSAVADVVFGDVNPSGKLPTTFPKRWEDCPAFGNFPGTSAVNYAEGIYVGYRHFDTRKVDVDFPFGFGLSYTTFALSNAAAMPVDYPGHKRFLVTVDLQNTGPRAGAEVVQLYVHSIGSPVDRPEKELKGFRKIFLGSGEKKTAQFILDDRSLAYYDVSKKDWTVAPGEYEIQLGNSSRNILLRTTITVARP
jgi:beta-glucosidase